MAKKSRRQTDGDFIDAPARRLAEQLHAVAAGASERLLQATAKLIAEDERHPQRHIMMLHAANLLVAYQRQTPKYLRAVANLSRPQLEDRAEWERLERKKCEGDLTDAEVEEAEGLMPGALAKRRCRWRRRDRQR